MRHWTQLGVAPIPGSRQTLSLYQSKDDFHIIISGGHELMNTRKHASEDALGRLPCEKIPGKDCPRVLIGGLGMGFTLAAVLNAVGARAEVTVAELIPEVVEWNRGVLGERSGRPLDDPRSRVYVGDVADLLRAADVAYDVIVLDVDNGPEGLSKQGNNWLYSERGISAARKVLSSTGIVGYWSAAADNAFRQRLQHCGFRVEEIQVYAHGNKGARHTLWLAHQQLKQRSGK